MNKQVLVNKQVQELSPALLFQVSPSWETAVKLYIVYIRGEQPVETLGEIHLLNELKAFFIEEGDTEKAEDIDSVIEKAFQ